MCIFLSSRYRFIYIFAIKLWRLGRQENVECWFCILFVTEFLLAYKMVKILQKWLSEDKRAGEYGGYTKVLYPKSVRFCSVILATRSWIFSCSRIRPVAFCLNLVSDSMVRVQKSVKLNGGLSERYQSILFGAISVLERFCMHRHNQAILANSYTIVTNALFLIANSSK